MSISEVSALQANEANGWMKGLPRVAFLGVSKRNLPGQVGRPIRWKVSINRFE